MKACEGSEKEWKLVKEIREREERDRRDRRRRSMIYRGIRGEERL